MMKFHFRSTGGHTSLVPLFLLICDLGWIRDARGWGSPRATLPLLWFGGPVASMWSDGHRIQVEVNRDKKWPEEEKMRRKSQKGKEDKWVELVEDVPCVIVSAHLSK